MSSEDAEVYIMRKGEEGDWVNPTPARTAIVEAIVDSTDMDEDDLDGLDEYVDWDDLRAVLETDDDDEISFEVENVEVTVDADGDIAVE